MSLSFYTRWKKWNAEGGIYVIFRKIFTIMHNVITNKVLVVLFLSILLISCQKSDKVAQTTEQKSSSSNQGTAFNLDLTNSKIMWIGKKVTGQHNGTIKLLNGKVYIDKGQLVGGSFEIDMNSIFVEDIKDAGQNAKLTNHLKSADFFNVTEYPVAKFEITSILQGQKQNQNVQIDTIIGNLTIKNITKSIKFPASVKIENDHLEATADFDLDRTEWDIKYGSGKFFENLGDKMINDLFNIKLNISSAK